MILLPHKSFCFLPCFDTCFFFLLLLFLHSLSFFFPLSVCGNRNILCVFFFHHFLSLSLSLLPNVCGLTQQQQKLPSNKCHECQFLSIQQGRSGQLDDHLPLRGKEGRIRGVAGRGKATPLPIHGPPTTTRVPVPAPDPEDESWATIHMCIANHTTEPGCLDLQLGRLRGPGLRPFPESGSKRHFLQWCLQCSHPLCHRCPRLCVSIILFFRFPSSFSFPWYSCTTDLEYPGISSNLRMRSFSEPHPSNLPVHSFPIV